MRTLPVAATLAVTALGGLSGCSSAAAADMAVGDCVKMSGPPDRPEATKTHCGSPESNFKVVAVFSGTESTDLCPADVDSYYSMRSAFSDSRNTICLDIDWVVGDCMSIDPDNGRDPLRVDCRDASMPDRQRATQILRDAGAGQVGVDECASGIGYAYEERDFTVCVEDVA